VIPTDPWLSVEPARLETARDWLANKGSDQSETKVHIFDKLRFFDAGANFTEVRCPSCRTNVSLEDWDDWMNEDSDGEAFRLSPKRLGCCDGVPVTLNDLKYEFHQAFGLCAVEGMNLDKGALSGADIEILENLLGTRISVVYQHI